MQCLVVYDIPDDRKRTRIADVCQDYGLDRIQYSTFTGQLQQTHQEELLQKLRRTLGKKPGSILLLAICQKDWQERREVIIQAGPEPQEPKDAASKAQMQVGRGKPDA